MRFGIAIVSFSFAMCHLSHILFIHALCSLVYIYSICDCVTVNAVCLCVLFCVPLHMLLAISRKYITQKEWHFKRNDREKEIEWIPWTWFVSFAHWIRDQCVIVELGNNGMYGKQHANDMLAMTTMTKCYRMSPRNGNKNHNLDTPHISVHTHTHTILFSWMWILYRILSSVGMVAIEK